MKIVLLRNCRLAPTAEVDIHFIWSSTLARKPLAAAVVGTLLMVVCDDGSVYEMDPNGAWVERRPVPGTPAAHADEIRRQEPRFD
jgi:hypothetical protein